MVKKQIVSSSLVKSLTYGGINGKKYIVIHETANTSKGANAQAHANLQSNGNSRQASWQYTVDDKQVLQSFSDNAQCWHAGNKYYNKNGIGIEICVNSDGNYKKAVENAAKLTKRLVDKYNISLNDVVQHNTASGKDCPHFIRSGSKGITWGDFKYLVKGGEVTSKPSKPSKPKPSKNKLVVDGSWGNATSKALQQHFKLKIKDGVISGQPKNQSTRNIPSAKYGTTGSNLIRAMQRHYKSGVVDGVISGKSNLITAMQRKYGLSIIDGRVSFPSNLVKEIQRRLNNDTL